MEVIRDQEAPDDAIQTIEDAIAEIKYVDQNGPCYLLAAQSSGRSACAAQPRRETLGGGRYRLLSRLRLFAGIALASCPALPMATCGETPQYVVQEIELNPLTSPWGLAFLWPIPLWQLRRHVRSRRFGSALFVIEAPGLLGSLYAVSAFSILSRPFIGCFVGWAALAGHAFAWAWEARSSMSARRPTSGAADQPQRVPNRPLAESDIET